jgi:hypothetical protein
MTAISGEPRESKFSENVIEQGIQELAKLYDHDYGGEAQQFEPMIANDAQIDGARR